MKFAAFVFFAFQLFMIADARFSPLRYFCWSPHDCHTEYELTVFVNGRELSDKEIYQRYRREKNYVDVRSPEHPKDMIMQYERTYGRNDKTSVIMKYRVNGIPQEPWQWSSPQ